MKVFLKYYLLFFFFLTTAATAAVNPAVEARLAYANWCASINKAKGNAAEMAKYYAPHAILLPTLSPKILFNDSREFTDYFVKLTSHKDIKCTTNKLLTEVSGEMVMNIGLYTFSYMDDSGKMKSVPARFTFVYKNYNRHWLIIHHHSSALLSEE
jgi:hypothetical protein